MTDQFLYETLSPILVITTIAFLSAEFIGRSKHIGRGYSFFMMLSIIPGIIGLLFSPSAKNKPTKANSLYNILGAFLIIVSIFGIFRDIDNITFVQIFVTISFITSAIYCFELAKGNIINEEPKYYFEKQSYAPTERKFEQVKTSLDSSISNLTDLKNKGILTELEYYEKIANIKTKKAQQDILDSTEYKQLKSLLNSGVLTKEEFENKVKLIQIKTTSQKNTKIEIVGNCINILFQDNKKIMIPIKYISDKKSIIGEDLKQYEIIYMDTAYTFYATKYSRKIKIKEDGKHKHFDSLQELIKYIIS